MTRKIADSLLTFWTLVTTVVHTIAVGVPVMLAALTSRRGVTPYRIGRIWSWLVFKTNLVRLQVIGAQNVLKERSYIFIANHSSFLDPLAASMAVPHTIRFVGKDFLTRIPIFGQAARLARMIFIDSKNTKEAIEKINDVVRELQDGISAFVFAEGTRSFDGRLLPFKKGGVMLAIRSKLPVVPITIIDSHKLMPRKSWHIRPGRMKVIVGEPIDTSQYSEEDRDKLLNRVYSAIQANLQKFSDIYDQQKSEEEGKEECRDCKNC